MVTRENTSYLGWLRYTSVISQAAYLLADGTRKPGLPEGITKTTDFTARTITLTGTPTVEGDYRLLITLTGLDSEKVNDTITLRVLPNPTGIEEFREKKSTAVSAEYDLQGRPTTTDGRGLFITRRNNRYVKMVK